MFNTRVVETSKLVNEIDIIINNSQQKKYLLSDFNVNKENKNLELNSNNLLDFITTLFNKIININSIIYNNNVK